MFGLVFFFTRCLTRLLILPFSLSSSETEQVPAKYTMRICIQSRHLRQVLDTRNCSLRPYLVVILPIMQAGTGDGAGTRGFVTLAHNAHSIEPGKGDREREKKKERKKKQRGLSYLDKEVLGIANMMKIMNSWRERSQVLQMILVCNNLFSLVFPRPQ